MIKRENMILNDWVAYILQGTYKMMLWKSELTILKPKHILVDKELSLQIRGKILSKYVLIFGRSILNIFKNVKWWLKTIDETILNWFVFTSTTYNTAEQPDHTDSYCL